MEGSRITSEEKSTLSTYLGVGIAILLAIGGIYLFFAAQHEKRETSGFDPNRPVADDATLRRRLTQDQYNVVRGTGTQTPFQNDFWDEERTGLYCDITTGEPLFTSVDKYNAGVGLPSFTKPISKDLLVTVMDNSLGMQRVEIHAKRSNARLGHFFPDPKSPTGERFTLYSAALRFIPMEQMEEKGYKAFLPLLEKK